MAEKEMEKTRAEHLDELKMEAVGTLAGGIAHVFNNLLQGIYGNADLILDGKTPKDPDYEELTEIINFTRRGMKLVRQLLMCGRKVDAQKRPVSL